LYLTAATKYTDLQIEFLTYDYLLYLVLVGIILGVFGSSISAGKFIKAKNNKSD
jgi:hypothetical protein